MTTVAFLWGITNPFLRKGSLQANCSKYDSFSKKYLNCLISFFNWRCFFPFVINQCGSVIYMMALGTLDLSIAVPVVNGLTLIITVVTGNMLHEKINAGLLLGSVMIMFGITCITIKI